MTTEQLLTHAGYRNLRTIDDKWAGLIVIDGEYLLRTGITPTSHETSNTYARLADALAALEKLSKPEPTTVLAASFWRSMYSVVLP